MAPRRRHDPYFIATAVRFAILVWSAGLLTASYMNIVKNPDEAFIASIFTATLSTFGIEKLNTSSSSTEKGSSAPPRPPVRTTRKP